jgi:hypothetical protein
MQYVITNQNEGGFVLLGPVPWNARYFSAIISDEVDSSVEFSNTAEQSVPFSPVDGIIVRRCYVEYAGDLNPIIHKFDGPTWTYFETPEIIEGTSYQAKATYTVVEKNINIIKDELKARVAAERWKRENKGVTVAIQGNDVWCDTSRGNRDIFMQKYILMGENDIIRWKFPSMWLDLNKTELGTIVALGAGYIQQQFNWESTTVASIDNAQTTAELLQIQIEDPQSTEGSEE